MKGNTLQGGKVSQIWYKLVFPLLEGGGMA